MRDRMARDVEVLQEVMQTHDLTVKQLASRSGIAQKSIYKYLSEVRTLPSEVLRAAFEMTLDHRLLSLITGVIPVIHQAVFDGGPACAMQSHRTGATSQVRLPPINELLRRTCESIEAAAKAAPYMARIIEDGRVNEMDAADIAKFREHSTAARENLSLMEAAIEAHLRKGTSCQRN